MLSTYQQLFLEIFTDRYGASRYTYASFAELMQARYNVQCGRADIDEILNLIDTHAARYKVLRDTENEFRIARRSYQGD